MPSDTSKIGGTQWSVNRLASACDALGGWYTASFHPPTHKTTAQHYGYALTSRIVHTAHAITYRFLRGSTTKGNTRIQIHKE